MSEYQTFDLSRSRDRMIAHVQVGLIRPNAVRGRIPQRLPMIPPSHRNILSFNDMRRFSSGSNFQILDNQRRLQLLQPASPNRCTS